MTITINGTNTAANPGITGADTDTGLQFGTDEVNIVTGGTTRATVDSSGRLLVGTSSARTNAPGGTEGLLLEGTSSTNSQNRFAQFFYGEAGAAGPYIGLAKHRSTSIGGNTIVNDGDELGGIYFQGADGSDFRQGASIIGLVDGTPGASDMPGRLAFSTTSDGASFPTERMRIRANGSILCSSDANAQHFFIDNTNASLNTTLFYVDSSRAAHQNYSFFAASSSNNTDNEFILRGDGNAYAEASWNGGGADYAEYFEWSDANPDAEDRRGISVVLDEEKIRPAVDGEDPIGVISGNPSVVGDAAWNKWSGKYLRDDYGTYIQEDYEVEDADGNTVIQQRRKLNPDYDPNQEYVNREQRPEWDCVGLMGKLRIRKGQPTGSRWIKMRDISDSVEEWLVR